MFILRNATLFICVILIAVVVLGNIKHSIIISLLTYLSPRQIPCLDVDCGIHCVNTVAVSPKVILGFLMEAAYM